MPATPVDRLIAYCKEIGCPFLEQEPLSRHTSFRIGGPARLFLQPHRTEQLAGLAEMVRESGLPWVVMGNGSNVLAADEGFPGVVIQMGPRFSAIELEGEGRLRCQAGASLAAVSRFSAENGLSGMEFACGIPGAVGGAVYMNAGAYGGEIAQRLLSVVQVAVPREGRPFLERIPADELDFSYRHSRYQSRELGDERVEIIAEAVFQLEPGDRENSLAKMEELLQSRREKQPLEYPSAGSTFKRPEGSYASLLIDQCGLKGLRVGGAQVSEKHAGFIVNLGGASCKDVEELIAVVQQRVREETGYLLLPEVRLLKNGWNLGL